MKTLTIDTASSLLSLLLTIDEKDFRYEQQAGLRHAEDLMPSILFLLERGGISPKELDLIVCSRGPGSFTGLRIGISTAKGLGFAHNTPVVTIPTLDMWGKSDLYPEDSVVAAVIDAKKSRFFAGIYQNKNLLLDYIDAAPGEILALLEKYDKVILAGYDAQAFRERVSSERSNWNLYGGISGIDVLYRLGVKQFEHEGADSPDKGPLYLRKSEAEIARDQRR